MQVGSRTHNPGHRTMQGRGKFHSERDINLNPNNITSHSGHMTETQIAKKKTLSQKFFGGMNKYLKN